MSDEIKKLEPKQVWNNFYKLTEIPRPSKKEEKIIAFLKAFGEGLNLETHQDKTGNILIRKPATKGLEDRMVITLQSHMDMVPQKNKEIQHDFEKDPIDAYIDGEWVTARGTTLGADNGMGLAASMGVLEDNTIEHGPIEVFITVDEETGMTGAFGLEEGFLQGDILLNLDSEDEGELYIGCAGGVDTLASFTYKHEAIAAEHTTYNLIVKGLKGGHSGMDIIIGRGNAIKILSRVLWEYSRKHSLEMASINSGEVRNAIPRESEAVVLIPNADVKLFEQFVSDFSETMKSEFKSTDAGVEVIAVKTETPAYQIDSVTKKNLINALYALPNGVYSMIADMPEIVETSTNLSVIATEDNTINLVSLTRGSVDSRKFTLAQNLEAIYEMAGAKTVHEGAYPGWNPDIHSPILKAMKTVYNDAYGKIPEVKVIHAGLECGIIKAVKSDMDAISFGPTIRNPHSPDEKVKIDTVAKFWDFLLQTLKHAPVKK